MLNLAIAVSCADIVQPMSLDELVSKAMRRGIDGVGWKGQLARFLDLQVGQKCYLRLVVLMPPCRALYTSPGILREIGDAAEV